MFVKVPGVPIDVLPTMPAVQPPPETIPPMACDPSTTLPPVAPTKRHGTYIGITDETRVDL